MTYFFPSATQTPFVLNYRTDAYEGATAATDESGNNNVGYLLNYDQDATGC